MWFVYVYILIVCILSICCIAGPKLQPLQSRACDSSGVLSLINDVGDTDDSNIAAVQRPLHNNLVYSSSMLVDNINLLAHSGGFDILFQLISAKNSECITGALAVISAISPLLSRVWGSDFFNKLYDVLVNAINNMNEEELRSFHKEHSDHLLEHFKFVCRRFYTSSGVESDLGVSEVKDRSGEEERKEVTAYKKESSFASLEKLKLIICLKCMKSEILSVRLHGLKYLHDVIDSVNKNLSQFITPAYLVQWIKEKNIISKTIALNNHSEIITRGMYVYTYLFLYLSLSRDLSHPLS